MVLETIVKREDLNVARVYAILRGVTGGEYISTSEAADELGISRQRVLQLIDDGRLDAKKFANVYMIKRSSLSAVKDRRPGRPPKDRTEKTPNAVKKRGGKK